MDAVLQAVRGLRIDRALFDHAAEGRLDMPAGTAEPVIQVEVPEGGVEIVAPKQMHDPPSEPHAFRISRRSGDLLGHIGQIVATLRVLARLGFGVGRLLLLRLGLVVVLSRGGGAKKWQYESQREGQPRDGSQETEFHDGGILETPFPLNGLEAVTRTRFRQQYDLRFGNAGSG